jgi:hypothetical protein
MSKQVNFFATDNDRLMIANILNRVFGELIIVPFHKGQFSLFNSKNNDQMLYLAEDNRKTDIVYRTHEYYDGTTSELLDYRKSPVLEYSLSTESPESEFRGGRFYCCSEDTEFSKKVSNFFNKLKKEFWYVKKWKKYISKSIDIDNSLFLPNRTVKITKEDLS